MWSSPLRSTGDLAWFWNLGLPWSTYAMQAMAWVAAGAMVVGGVSVVGRWLPGMRVGLIALALSALMLAVKAGAALSLALGWLQLGYPPFGPLRTVPPWIWWWALLPVSIQIVVVVVAIVWVWRELVALRAPSGGQHPVRPA